MDYFSRAGKLLLSVAAAVVVEGANSMAQNWLKNKSKIGKERAGKEFNQVCNMTRNQLTKGYDITNDDKYNF